jgi:biotin carboxylase
MDRVLLLMPTTTYKAADFLAAAERLGVEVVVGTERRQALERVAPHRTLALDLRRPSRALAVVAAAHRRSAFRAVLGLDDEMTVLAARAAAALGLPHNDVAAVRAARDKLELRRRLAAAGRPGPWFRRFAVDDPPERIARRVGYPCVLKPRTLSGSRGVLRADDAAAFVEAFARVAAILRAPDVRAGGGETRSILVEEFLSGPEYAVEGLLRDGRLRLLALFDKPDPLEGPTFEETIYLTPSRLSPARRRAIAAEAAAGCAALGLRDGPVHAEVRLHGGRPWLVELAPRTIGGLCSRTLRFGAGLSLEEVVLRHALGRRAVPRREARAAGVMMIPVPRAGVLHRVDGLAAARSVAGVEEVTLAAHRGARLEPPPEGHRYVGFILARGDTPERVEHALRQAHGLLRFAIADGVTSPAGSRDSRRRSGRSRP